MTNRFFITLLLSAPLMLPGLPQRCQAQQADSNAGAPTAPRAAAPEREPLRPVTSADFWDGDDPNVVHLIMHPFASKKYVRRHTEPIRDRLNELEQITAENTKRIKDVDAGAQHGIQLAAEKNTLADQHAGDAALQAQVAKAAAADATTRASGAEQMVGSLDQYKDASQTEIHFRSGQGVLSAQAKDALDQLTAPLKDQHSYIIEVHGFAAGNGQAAIQTSRMMAGSVVRYLVLSRRIPMYRIYAVGLGNASEAGERTTAKQMTGGRVEVNVLKNDVVSSSQH